MTQKRSPRYKTSEKKGGAEQKTGKTPGSAACFLTEQQFSLLFYHPQAEQKGLSEVWNKKTPLFRTSDWCSFLGFGCRGAQNQEKSATRAKS